MAYNEALASRVRSLLSEHKALAEIKMFGGLCWTIRGNMACGVLKDDLVLRVDPTVAAKYLTEPHARPMDFTGRPMKNFLFVSSKACSTPAGLKKWVSRSVDYALSLKPKA
jgi:TfoX/Sxy family transcriptional regulator of competence genes